MIHDIDISDLCHGQVTPNPQTLNREPSTLNRQSTALNPNPNPQNLDISDCHGQVTTPESSKGSPKVNFPLEAVVFKSGERVLTRF